MQPSATNTPAPKPASDRLDSWKEIAGYLKREIRTVQRWEVTEGLPVYRHQHLKQGAVYAYASELDTWWHNRRLELEPQAQSSTQVAEILDAVPKRVRRPFSPSAQRALGALGLSIILVVVLLFLPHWSRRPLARPPASRMLSVIESNLHPEGSGMQVATGDVSGDGVPDIVIGEVSTGETGIFFGGKLRPVASFSRDADVLIQDEQGQSLNLLGMADINGDGIQDLIFAEGIREPQAFTRTGPVLVLFGRREWKSRIQLPRDADLTISIPFPYNAVPMAAANAGRADLNGDGIDELIVVMCDFSPPGRASAGGVFVFWGRKNWPAKLDISAADVTVWGGAKGEGLVEAKVGDVNGDGRNDLILVASDSTLWGMRGLLGHGYVFFGRPHFPRILDAATDYDVRIDGAPPYNYFHTMSVGDVNGDGIQDIITIGETKLGVGPESIMVFYGRKSWPRNFRVTDPDWQVIQSAPQDRHGTSVVAKELVGDGADDLIVCAPHGPDAQLEILHGGPDRHGTTYSDAADLVMRVGSFGEGVCAPHPAVASFDGKQAPQILVGANMAPVGALPHAGKVYIFAPYVPIKIDIRPGGYPNLITPGSDRVVAMAILHDGDFDPESVDVSTLRLAGVPPISSETCTFGGEYDKALCVFFDAKNIRLKPSDRIAILTGKLKDGTPVYGSDSVLVLSQPKSNPQ